MQQHGAAGDVGVTEVDDDDDDDDASFTRCEVYCFRCEQ